jgi:hypothetical protein
MCLILVSVIITVKGRQDYYYSQGLSFFQWRVVSLDLTPFQSADPSLRSSTAFPSGMDILHP